MLTYYCWHCYETNRRASGPCEHCGEEIQAPEGTSYDERLLWALKHPLSERRMTAVRVLGARHVARASGPLRELVGDRDPYLAAAALEALLEIDGAERHSALLGELSESAPPQVREVARRFTSRAPAARRSGG